MRKRIMHDFSNSWLSDKYPLLHLLPYLCSVSVRCVPDMSFPVWHWRSVVCDGGPNRHLWFVCQETALQSAHVLLLCNSRRHVSYPLKFHYFTYIFPFTSEFWRWNVKWWPTKQVSKKIRHCHRLEFGNYVSINVVVTDYISYKQKIYKILGLIIKAQWSIHSHNF